MSVGGNVVVLSSLLADFHLKLEKKEKEMRPEMKGEFL